MIGDRVKIKKTERPLALITGNQATVGPRQTGVRSRKIGLQEILTAMQQAGIKEIRFVGGIYPEEWMVTETFGAKTTIYLI